MQIKEGWWAGPMTLCSLFTVLQGLPGLAVLSREATGQAARVESQLCSQAQLAATQEVPAETCDSRRAGGPHVRWSSDLASDGVGMWAESRGCDLSPSLSL